MATPFHFERRFDQAGERIVAGDALTGRGPVRASEAAPLDLPWLERPRRSDAAPAPTPTFSEADLQAAVAAARAEAVAESEARVRAEVENEVAARQAAALERLGAALAASQAMLDHWVAARASASRDLALALARALVPRALERQPLADTDAMLRDLVLRLDGQPRLRLTLPPDLVDDGRRLLAAVAAEAGHRGELLVEPDPALRAGDARLNWAGGQAERNLADLEREAIGLVDAWLATSDGPPSDHRHASTDAATP